jgi:ABC-type nitrate/sulfonate/bicarbonate transport system permease component
MHRLRRVILASLIPLAVLVVWAIAAGSSPIVPGPGEVTAVLARPFDRPELLDTTSLAHGTAISILRVAAGLGLAVAIGLPVGLAMGLLRPLRDMLWPVVAVIMVVSPIAWLPISILAFGLASPATVLAGQDAWQWPTLDRLRFAIVAVIALGAVWPILVNTASGVRQVRRSYIEHVRLMGGSRWAVLRLAVWPAALPAIATGLRLAAAIAWRVIVAAEIFPGTRSGLGTMISTAHEVGQYQYAFAAIAVIAAIGLSIDGLFRLLEARLSRWRRHER